MSRFNGLPKYHGLLELNLSSRLASGFTRSLKHHPHTILPPSAKIHVNASRGLKGSTATFTVKSRTRKKFNSRDDGLKRKKELYLQKKAKQRQQFEEQSGTTLVFSQALDVKESMLEIQSLLLGKLAAEENHFKGLVKIPGVTNINLDERVKEVEEALTMLKY
ncbi:hypothetical protein BGZ60DRAFT_533069 [Tricladium varicosporioides]|nr:hypothetical protein BGZ60DRAFT_533069 [Hymenoscyphus varicosporioides]